MNATVLLKSVDISIPGYKILKPIGEGGMASVFLAVQESLDREVALKVMSPVLAANAEFAHRFLIEGKITAKLQHPNLVTVYDIGSHNGVYYLAAEYIPGGTLKERVTAGGLTNAEMLDIISDIAMGLDFAHQKGFVHRDVKPGNVLFRNDGRVVLADFGIAKAMDGSNSSTVAGTSVGTPDYMSPEQARGEPVDGRSDLYSLGTMFYEMLVGHPPYQASDPFTVALMHVTQPVPQLPEETAWLQPLIAGLMAKMPGERYNTGAAFVDALQKLVASAPESAQMHQASGRRAGSASSRLSGSGATQQRTRVGVSQVGARPRWVVPAGLGGGVLVLAVSGWLLMSHGNAPTTATPANGGGDTTAAANSDPGTKPLPADFQAPQSIDSPTQEVDQWLNAGDALLENGLKEAGRRLVTPPDNSALMYYNQVLQTDPQNARAKAGIAAIVGYYRKMSYRLCEKEMWPSCGVIAKVGLQADPSDEVLKQIAAAADAAGRGETPKLPPKPAD